MFNRFLEKKISLTIGLVLFALVCASSSVHAFAVTSAFGWRTHPIDGEEKFHTGVDLAEEYGTPIGAIWAGKVAFSGAYGGYGNVVIIDHGNNVITLYGHCAELTVQAGQVVAQGDLIGYVGSSGYSTGPHLHLELWRDGKYVDPLTIWE